MADDIDHPLIYYDHGCHEVGNLYPRRDVINWFHVCEYLRVERMDGTAPARCMTREAFVAAVTEQNIVRGTQAQINHFLMQCHMMTFRGIHQRIRRGTSHTGQKYYWGEQFTHQLILFPPYYMPTQGNQPIHPDLRTQGVEENGGADPLALYIMQQFAQQQNMQD